MNLYLMRHGIAAEPHEWRGGDEFRPLTEEGWEKTRLVLDALIKKHTFKPDEIWSSPLVRAQQTAQIAAEFLKLPIRNCPALACGSSVKKLQKFFETQKAEDSILLVGHEPDMGEILADLTGAEEVISFKKAGIAYLKGDLKPSQMKVQYFLAPKDLLE